MKWFIYIIMLGMYADGTKDTYLITNPTLPTLEECQAYVYNKSDQIKRDMMIEFKGKSIERVFCIEEQQLKKYFEAMQGENKEGKSI